MSVNKDFILEFLIGWRLAVSQWESMSGNAWWRGLFHENFLVIRGHLIARVYLVACKFYYYTVSRLYSNDPSEVAGGEMGIFNSTNQSLVLYIYLWSFVSAAYVYIPDCIIFKFNPMMTGIALSVACDKFWLWSISSRLSGHYFATKSTKYCPSYPTRLVKYVFLVVFVYDWNKWWVTRKSRCHIPFELRLWATSSKSFGCVLAKETKTYY